MAVVGALQTYHAKSARLVMRKLQQNNDVSQASKKTKTRVATRLNHVGFQRKNRKDLIKKDAAGN